MIQKARSMSPICKRFPTTSQTPSLTDPHGRYSGPMRMKEAASAQLMFGNRLPLNQGNKARESESNIITRISRGFLVFRSPSLLTGSRTIKLYMTNGLGPSRNFR